MDTKSLWKYLAYMHNYKHGESLAIPPRPPLPKVVKVEATTTTTTTYYTESSY